MTSQQQSRATSTEVQGRRHNGGPRSSHEIQEELDRTRAEMDGTLSAIEQRLSPGELLDSALHYLRNGSGGHYASEYAHNLTDSIKHNPLPSALIGVGVAWMMVSGSRTGGKREAETPSGRDVGRLREASRHAGQELGQRTAGVRHKAEAVAQAGRQKAGETAEAARQAGHGLRESATGVAKSTSYYTGQWSGEIARRSQRASEGIRDMFQEHPLLMGLAGLTIGAGLAALLPGSRTEDRTFGPSRERLAREARERTEAEAERLAEVARRTGESARNEAQRQGLTPETARREWEDVRRRAGQVGETALNTARQEMSRQHHSDSKDSEHSAET